VLKCSWGASNIDKLATLILRIILLASFLGSSKIKLEIKSTLLVKSANIEPLFEMLALANYLKQNN
jgi:hypothetical protein